MQEILPPKISASTPIVTSSSTASITFEPGENKKDLKTIKNLKLDPSKLKVRNENFLEMREWDFNKNDMLGKSSSGYVVRGTYETQTVGIKFKIPNTIPECKHLQQKVQFQATMRAGLNSDFLMSIKGYSLEPPLLVMELLPYTLLTLLEKSSADKNVPDLSSWPNRYRVLRDIAFGLAILHDNDFVYCDLNAANVLIDKDGGAKLGDFDEIVKSSEAEFTGNATALYAAPEVMNYEAPTFAGDVYSFGIMCLTVTLPIHKDENYEKIKSLLPALQEGRPDIERPKEFPPQLIDVIYACCARDPKQRSKIAKVAEVLEKLWQDAAKPKNLSREKKEDLSEKNTRTVDYTDSPPLFRNPGEIPGSFFSTSASSASHIASICLSSKTSPSCSESSTIKNVS